jgi:hypothetical protein
VREREEEDGALGREERHVAVCVPPLPGGALLYIVGRECALPLSQANKGGGQGGAKGGGG